MPSIVTQPTARSATRATMQTGARAGAPSGPTDPADRDEVVFDPFGPFALRAVRGPRTDLRARILVMQMAELNRRRRARGEVGEDEIRAFVDTDRLREDVREVVTKPVDEIAHDEDGLRIPPIEPREGRAGRLADITLPEYLAVAEAVCRRAEGLDASLPPTIEATTDLLGVPPEVLLDVLGGARPFGDLVAPPAVPAPSSPPPVVGDAGLPDRPATAVRLLSPPFLRCGVTDAW